MIFQLDYYRLYAAGRLILEGKNCYDLDALTGQVQLIGWDPLEDVYGLPYPPWSFFAFVPFSVFPFPVARILWLLVSALAIGWSIYLIAGSSAFKKMTGDQASKFTLLLLSVLFFPLAKTLAYGQTSWVCLLGLSLFMLGYERGRDFLAGAALSLCLVKFHLFLPLAITLGIFSLTRGKYRLIAGVFVGGALQVGVCHLLAPHAFSAYLNYANQFAAKSEGLPMPTLRTFLGAGGFEIPAWLLPLLSVPIAVWAGLNRGATPGRLLIYFLPISLLVSPYAWSHDFLVLAFPFITVGAYYARNLEPGRLAVLLLSLFTLSFYLLEPGLEKFLLWIPLVTLASALSMPLEIRTEAVQAS